MVRGFYAAAPQFLTLVILAKNSSTALLVLYFEHVSCPSN